MRKRRLGISAIAAALTFACVGDDVGTLPTIADPSRKRIIYPGDLARAYGSEVISDIQIVDLGTLPGGANSTAADINDAGDIVGRSETMSGEEHAFILSGRVMTDIGTFSGGDRSSATGINNLGQVVGSARKSVRVIHGFVWESGVLRDLGAFPPEHDIGSQSIAFAINDAGLIAGAVDAAGVVWDLAGVPNFPPFPPFVRVTDPGPFEFARSNDINNAGQAVGALAGLFGFRWQSGVLEPLTPLGPANDEAFGINELGQVVGRGLLAPPVRHHAVLWPDPSTVLDLGTLGGDNSEARDINDDGLVIGHSETDAGETVAFVWREDLGMHPLGTLGGANSKAFAVNAAGQIVGEAETSTGEVHAALWTITLATVVPVDVKPGSRTNSVNPRSRGGIPVAILTYDGFDATSVDPLSVSFGPAGASEMHGRGHIEDVDGDGTSDLVLHFRTQETGIQCGDSEAILTGVTFAGDAIHGSDAIRTVGCE